MQVNNLAKFEWENEVPFSVEVITKTLHALLGEGESPRDPNFVLGLISHNPENKKWNFTPINPRYNDAFGSASFDLVAFSVSITYKKKSDNSTNLKFVLSARQGNIRGENQSYLQSECDAFITALSYYLDKQEFVVDWHTNYKPTTLAQNEQRKNNKGCLVFLPFLIGSGAFLSYIFL